jgi:lactoylglutathione lyase
MVTDMEASLRFYVDGLGFKKTIDWLPHGKVEWCWLENGGAALMLQEYRPGLAPDARRGVGISVCFMCDDALAIHRASGEKGLKAEKKPFVGNNLWVVHFKDPDGYDIYFESPSTAPEDSEFNEQP